MHRPSLLLLDEPTAGRRPQGAARVLGRDPPAGGGRADGAGLDPLHGRGRALPPDQLHLLRPAGGAAGRWPRWSRGAGLTTMVLTGRGHRRGGEEAGSGAPGRRADRALRQHAARRRAATPAALKAAVERVAAETGTRAGAGRDQPGGRVHPAHGRRPGQHGHETASALASSRLLRAAAGRRRRIQMRRDRLTFAMMLGVPAGAADAVRLRHQHRPQGPARRAGGADAGPFHPRHRHARWN